MRYKYFGQCFFCSLNTLILNLRQIYFVLFFRKLKSSKATKKQIYQYQNQNQTTKPPKLNLSSKQFSEPRPPGPGLRLLLVGQPEDHSVQEGREGRPEGWKQGIARRLGGGPLFLEQSHWVNQSLICQSRPPSRRGHHLAIVWLGEPAGGIRERRRILEMTWRGGQGGGSGEHPFTHGGVPTITGWYSPTGNPREPQILVSHFLPRHFPKNTQFFGLI